MTSSQNTRTSHKRKIPGNYILNWQSPGAQGAKPVVRRPMTACEACRIAKVKCNGQQKCDRCISRGIYCKYATTAAATPPTPPPSLPTTTTTTTTTTTSSASCVNHNLSGQKLHRTSTDAPSPLIQMPSEQMLIDWNIDTADPFYIDDWPPLDIDQNVFDSQPNLSSTDLDFVESLIKITPLYPTTPPLHSDSHSADSVPMSHPSGLLLQNQLSSDNCQCRASLMLEIPNIKSAMQEKPKPQLDRVFKVIGDVIRTSRNFINCENRQVSYTDLVCITAVLQQTDTCFEYIAKDDLISAIKVSVGEYEVSIINNIKLRRMLVMNLVKQANALLYSLICLGQSLVLSQPVPPRHLNQINFDYLQEVVENFKKILGSIAGSFNESDFDSVGLLKRT